MMIMYEGMNRGSGWRNGVGVLVAYAMTRFVTVRAVSDGVCRLLVHLHDL